MRASCEHIGSNRRVNLFHHYPNKVTRTIYKDKKEKKIIKKNREMIKNLIQNSR